MPFEKALSITCAKDMGYRGAKSRKSKNLDKGKALCDNNWLILQHEYGALLLYSVCSVLVLVNSEYAYKPKLRHRALFVDRYDRS